VTSVRADVVFGQRIGVFGATAYGWSAMSVGVICTNPWAVLIKYKTHLKHEKKSFIKDREIKDQKTLSMKKEDK